MTDETGPLKTELDAFTGVLLDRLGAHSQDLFKGQIDQAIAQGVDETSLKPGVAAPGFELPDAKGNAVALSPLLAQGPVVLTFYRGGWCPYCNIQLRAYQAILEDLKALGASLVAVSPAVPDDGDAPDDSDGQDPDFHVLSDFGNATARQYGLVYRVSERVHEILSMVEVDLAAHNKTEDGELPVPATYVIGTDGVIAFGGADPDYRTRYEPADILAAVKDLQSASA